MAHGDGQWCVTEAFNEQSDSAGAVVKSTVRSGRPVFHIMSAVHWLCDLLKLRNFSEP